MIFCSRTIKLLSPLIILSTQENESSLNLREVVLIRNACSNTGALHVCGPPPLPLYFHNHTSPLHKSALHLNIYGQ